MSDDGAPVIGERTRLSPSDARQVDRICDGFEAAWQAGQRPRPENYLSAIDEPVRTTLLRQLLLLDWDYRRRAGDYADVADYRARFPGEAGVIDDVRREMTESAATTHGAKDSDARPTNWSFVAGLCESESGVREPTGGSGKYDLLKEVGHGGIGVVFRGRDRHLGRDLAVKVLREAYRDSPEARRRFIAEARIGSQLQHPAIVPVYEQGWLDDRPYFTMKLVEGHTLAALLRDRADPGQDLPRFLGVFEQVCQAVAYAHARGVIHRDLKPANVMVGAFGEVQVMDWGFAKQLRIEEDNSPFSSIAFLDSPSHKGVGESQSGVMMGTPAYMPPEQARGESGQIGPQADVFALGAILCEILTGRPPYAGGTADEIWRRAAEGELGDAFARLAACRADDALRDLARRCLAADRGQRPTDAEVVARELTGYLASAQERLRQAQLERAAAEAREHEARSKATAERRARRLILAMAVALLCGTGVAVWQAIVAHRAKHDALTAMEAQTKAKQQALAAAAAQTEAKKAADVKEAETAAVLEFVEQRILAAARPAGQGFGLGRDVTLRRALEASLSVVDKSFEKQPLTEARLRMTLGHSFRHLGDPKTAAEQFRRARAIYSEHLGPQHLDTLASMTDLSVTYYALGRHPEALQLREDVLAGHQAVLGPDDPETLKCMANVANSYMALGRYADALGVHERALPLFKARLGPDHLDTLTSIHNVANCYHYLSRHAEALPLREHVVARRTETLGRAHPDTLLAMYNLAMSYAELGRHPEALKLDEETLAQQKALLGPDHPNTLATMNSLAGNYGAVGRHQDALKLYQETLALRRAKLGPDHVQTLITMHNLANSYHHLGQHEEALKLRQIVLARRRSQLGPDHPNTLTSMQNLALSYRRLGRLVKAQELLEQTLAGQRTRLGPDHRETLTVMGNLGAVYSELGRHADALRLREQAFAGLKVRLGPDHPDTLRWMAGVAESLTQLDRFAEAVPLIDECVRRATGQAAAREPLWDAITIRIQYFQKAKDAAGCRATAQLWESLQRTDAQSLYWAACNRGVTAMVVRATAMSPDAVEQAHAEADRAMAWLQKAVAAGFDGAELMKKDPGLDALRDRADFQKLVADMKAANGKAP